MLPQAKEIRSKQCDGDHVGAEKTLSESGEAKSVDPPAALRRAGFVFFDVYRCA
jgi:hypothetical protein